MDPIKTWSIVADKAGGHWHATVRRGVEGSRAKLGDLTFDLSDADDFASRITGIADVVMVRAISRALEALGKDGLLRAEPGPTLTMIAVDIGQTMRTELHELVIDHLSRSFGLRLDLAKVNG